MRYPCIESTLDIVVGEYTFRLWINQQEIPNTFQEELKYADIIENETLGSINTIPELMEKLIPQIPFLNAIQIKRGPYFGAVVYTVDFEKDIKG